MAYSLGWDYRLLERDWNKLCSVGLPGWELLKKDTPYSVFLEFVAFETPGSLEVATEWDDIARHDFYYRDWTKTGHPVVREGQEYWATFSFQRRCEAVLFQAVYGGKKNWEPGWQIHLDSIFGGL